MRRLSKREQGGASDLVVTYTRLPKEDLAELKRREVATGAPVAAQIRILVHEGLKTKGYVK